MKKTTKIFSIAIAAVMTTAVTASAMTFNEPMSHEFPLEKYSKNESFYSGYGHSCYPNINNFSGAYYYDNGYTTTTENNEEVKTIDSFDGTTKYMHIGYNASNPGYTLLNLMTDYGDNATATRFVGSFGKTRTEVTVRLSDYNGDGSESYRMGLYQNVIKADGTTAAFGVKAYYNVDTNKGYMLQTTGTSPNEQYLGQMLFDKWYRMIIDIDVQNSKLEFILEQYKDGTSGEIEKTTTRSFDIPAIKCVASSYYRWNSQKYAVDIANLKMTRDTLDIKNLTVDETSDDIVTASVQAASNAPANDYKHNYTYIDSLGNEKWVTGKESTLWSYDADTGIDRCVSKTTSPTLILVQYDKDGRLLKIEHKALDSLPTLKWGRTANEATRNNASDAGFAYQNLTVSFAKEANYSYAKAYVWNNINDIVPYTASISTEIAEETPAE